MRHGSFVRVQFPAPRGLVNKAVAPQVLGRAKFAQAIENMVPNKAGTLAKRFGVVAFGATNTAPNGNINRVYFYPLPNGNIQRVCHTDTGFVYTYNETTQTYTQIASGLSTTGIPRFTVANNRLIFCNGVDVPKTWDGTTWANMTEFVEDNLAAAETWISATSFSVNTGTRGAADYPNGRNIRLVITGSGLGISGITRSGSTATATTSVNHNLPTGTVVSISGAHQTEYNGTFVITNTGANTFTYTVAGTPATPATGSINYAFTSQQVSAVVSSTVLSGQVLTVTTTAAAFPAASVTITSLSFEVSPPAFRFIFAAQGRLWALGPGVPAAKTFIPDSDRNRVYYTTRIDVINSWYSTVTQQPSFFNTAGSIGQDDQLEAIAEFNDFICIMGRKRIGLYAGTDPSNAATWAFVKKMDVGCVSGDLVQSLPNDILFVSDFGVRTVSLISANEDVQISTDVGDTIDPDIKSAIELLTANDTSFRAARSFRYPEGDIIGFVLGGVSHIYFIQQQSRGWTRFTGFFSTISDAVGLPDGILMLANGASLYRYANDPLLSNIWADNGAPITAAWLSPWETINNARWANQRLIIRTTQDTAEQTVTVTAYRDNNTGFGTTTQLTLPAGAAYWDEAFWDEAYFDGVQSIKDTRFKFVAYSVALGLSCSNTTGPLEIVALELFGINER